MDARISKPHAASAAQASRAEQGLAHGISEQLQQLIYSGDIAPGERLNEAALALRMGTSRGPIREAIRMLTGIGRVVAVRNRGVFVREISVRESNSVLREPILAIADSHRCRERRGEKREEGRGGEGRG